MSMKNVILNLQSIHSIVNGFFSEDIQLKLFDIRAIVVFPIDEDLHVFFEGVLGRFQ